MSAMFTRRRVTRAFLGRPQGYATAKPPVRPVMVKLAVEKRRVLQARLFSRVVLKKSFGGLPPPPGAKFSVRQVLVRPVSTIFTRRRLESSFRTEPTLSGASSGAMALQDLADTFAAAGTSVVTGAVALQDVADTFASTGANIVVGTIALQDAADTFAAAGSAGSVAGAMSLQDAADTFAAAGSGTTAGAMDLQDRADTFSAAGDATPVAPPVGDTGDGHAYLFPNPPAKDKKKQDEVPLAIAGAVRAREPIVEFSTLAAEQSIDAAVTARDASSDRSRIIADHDPELAAFTAFMISLAENDDVLEEA